MAELSAALPHMPESLAVETFRMTLRPFQQPTALRAEIEQRAETMLCDNLDYACLKSLPGNRNESMGSDSIDPELF